VLQSAGIKAWKACGVSVSNLPSRRSRSILAASAVASAEALPSAVTSAVGLTARAAARRTGALAAAALRDDIYVISLLHDLVLAQFHAAIGDTLAGLHVVFHPVPRAHEVHLGLGEVQSARGLVRHDPLFDLGNGQSLAGRAALVQAEIAVSVKLALFLEHADFMLTQEHDAAVAVLDLRRLAHELLSHARIPSPWTNKCPVCRTDFERNRYGR